MQENIHKLKNEFEKVKAMGWILAPHNLYNENGTLFESLINKPVENFEIPDYEGIEIKTHLKSSFRGTTLFNANPEGKEFFEINRLCEEYGYPDMKIKETKILSGDVTAICRQNIGYKYKFMLSVDKKEQRIYLNIYDIKGNLVDKDSYWSFSMLEEKLYRKLSYLAYIDVETKRINSKIYFRYTDITFYKLKRFAEFITAIEKGRITVTFSVGVFRTGKRRGQLHNHGVAFKINHKYLELLFEPVAVEK